MNRLQSASQIVQEPNTFFFENLLHPFVRKLFLHLKEATLHLQWENRCWTYQFLVAFETYDIKSEAKRVQTVWNHMVQIR